MKSRDSNLGYPLSANGRLALCHELESLFDVLFEFGDSSLNELLLDGRDVPEWVDLLHTVRLYNTRQDP